MDYYKLLSDYLNATGKYENYEVLTFQDEITHIHVYYQFGKTSKKVQNDKEISLFELLTFVYSKIAV